MVENMFRLHEVRSLPSSSAWHMRAIAMRNKPDKIISLIAKVEDGGLAIIKYKTSLKSYDIKTPSLNGDNFCSGKK